MRKLIPLLVAFFVLGSTTVQAQGVPDYFLIQGRLVDKDLEAHSGLYDFQISLWGNADADDTNPTDTTGAFWQEQRSVQVNGQGFFEFKIGDQTALPDPFNFDTLQYLQLDAKPSLESDFTILDPLRDNDQVDRRSLISIPYRSTQTQGNDFATLDENGQISSSALPSSLTTTLGSLDSRLYSVEANYTQQQSQIDNLQTQIDALVAVVNNLAEGTNATTINTFVAASNDTSEEIELFEERILSLERLLEESRQAGGDTVLALPDLSIKINEAQQDALVLENEVRTLVNDSEDFSEIKKRIDRNFGSIAILRRYNASDQLSKERVSKIEQTFQDIEDRIRLIETSPRVIELGNEVINAESILISQENSEDIVTLESKMLELEEALLEIAQMHEELDAIKTIVETNESRIAALEEREATRSWKDPVSSLDQLNNLNGREGEIRYVVDEKSLQVYDGDEWSGVGGSEAGSLKQNTYSFAQIINIHTKREAQPGLFYWDRGNKQYFVGMADGSLKSLFSDVPLPGFVQQDEWTDLRFVEIAGRGFEKTKTLQYLQDSRLGLGLRSGHPNSWDQGMAFPELSFDRGDEKTVEFVFYSGSLDGRMMLGIADSDTTSVNKLGAKGFKHQKFALYMQSGSLSNKIFGQTNKGKTWSETYYKKNPWKRNSFYRFSFNVDKHKGIQGNIKIDQVDEKNFDQVVTNVADQPIPNLSFSGEQFMPLWLTHGNNSYRLAAVRITDQNSED